jgi:Gpi18-like mannosyltransferase
MNAIKSIKPWSITIAVAGIALAIAIRYSLLDFKSVDYLDYTKVWYNTIKASGFTAFSQNFSNYNPPYLYLLYVVVRLYPDLPGLIAIKIPSLVADFILAWLALQIVRLEYPKSSFPVFAAFGILFAPTIVLNSALWGQADAIYTAALVACVYFLMIKKHFLGLLCFGISISFKAQAIFLSPLLFALLLRKEIPWKYFLLIPFVMALSLVPSWVAGRPLPDLLMIYPAQAQQYEQLSMHAPSFFSWFPNYGRLYPYFYPAGLILTTVIALSFSILVYKSKAAMSPPVLMRLALLSVILMPFVLPKMLDRYFYPADVLSIIYAFYVPGYFYVAVAMTVISFFAYQPTLFNVEPVPISLLAVGVLFLITVLTKETMGQLFPAKPETKSSQTQ